jgi:hypothetical protein
MKKNSTINNYISEYQFKEIITDEELMSISEVFAKMKIGISNKIRKNILAYSLAVEFHKLDGLQSQMILN